MLKNGVYLPAYLNFIKHLPQTGNANLYKIYGIRILSVIEGRFVPIRVGYDSRLQRSTTSVAELQILKFLSFTELFQLLHDLKSWNKRV